MQSDNFGITAIYCRLSRDDGKESESNSIGNQKKLLSQKAKDLKLTNTKFYVDDGYTGTNFNRPGFQAMLEDIAILTGGQVVSQDLGLEFKDVTLDMLGRAGTVKVDKDNTTIINGAGNPAEIDARKQAIKAQIASTTSEYDKEKLQERLAKISGGVAVLYIGASTEVEMKEKKDRVDDALHATRAAVQEGIVPGGGVTLLRCSEKIINLKGENEDQKLGINIVYKTLFAPIKTILSK